MVAPDDSTKPKKPNEPEKEEELSEEDQQLKENLELMVERTKDVEEGVQKMAIQAIANEIRTATSSMTSVPKPLKFLRPHYDALKEQLEVMTSDINRRSLADVISALAMTSAPDGSRETLKYKLMGDAEEVSTWGHEYIKHLAGEIGEEYTHREAEGAGVEDLLVLINQIIPWNMTHNAEPEAIDLLLEVDRLDLLESHVDEKNCGRTCLYLLGCAPYLPEPDDDIVLRTAFAAYFKVGRHADALRVALRTGDFDLCSTAFAACSDPIDKKQLAYILGQHRVVLDLEDGPTAMEDDEAREELQQIMSNTRLSEQYLALARDLDVMEAKTPEDVYKMHLVEGRATSGPAVDSARANLAATFVNAFVNAGFGQDKLVTATSEDEGSVHWIFRNKDHGKMSAAASLGMVLLWDVEGGLPQIDRFLYSTDNNVVAGALLAVGMVNSGVVDEVDPALAILSEYVSRDDPLVRIGAILGLGVAYSGRRKAEVTELLLPLVMDTEVSMDVAGTAALAIALSHVGTADGEVVEALLQTMMVRSETDLSQSGGRLMCLALGLLFLQKQGAVEATVEVAKTLHERVSRFLEVTLETCAYAGTGDVLKVQQLLAACGEHIEADEASAWKASHQSVAALGLGLIAMSEELGAQMAHRGLEHLLQYGEPGVRRGVPLALALLNVSDPDMTVMDTLSRLSHDTDTEVAMNAIVALGFIGAGTNNARLAGLLRNLSAYYYKEPTLLFLVRLSQGLVHMGKGLLTINPYHSDNSLLSGPALAGLLVVLFASMDVKSTLAGKQHYLLYTLVTAIRPRMLMTVDEEGKMLSVPVRVGQAVDTVAQAGRPKTITGFQTHMTPVLLSVGERAELGTEKYLPASQTLEGIVVLRANPEYVETQE